MNNESHDIRIGTPACAGMVHLYYLQSVTGYIAAGIKVTIAGVGNKSLITRARNGILSRFHRNGIHTHLLFLDGDVHLPAAGLRRLLGHAEAFALLGAERVVQRFRPAILLERNGKSVTPAMRESVGWKGGEVPDTLALLRRWGYREFLPIDSDNLLCN